MAVRYANAVAIAALNAVTALANGGDLRIRDGTQPATGDGTPDGNVLATFTLPNPAFGAGADANPHAEATANTIPDVNASATGTATYYEVRNNVGTVLWTGTVSTIAAGTGDLQIASTSLTSGNPVSLGPWIHRHLEL